MQRLLIHVNSLQSNATLSSSLIHAYQLLVSSISFFLISCLVSSIDLCLPWTPFSICWSSARQPVSDQILAVIRLIWTSDVHFKARTAGTYVWSQSHDDIFCFLHTTPWNDMCVIPKITSSPHLQPHRTGFESDWWLFLTTCVILIISQQP